MKEYKFYRNSKANEHNEIFELYDELDKIWCRYSCAPRYREEWNEENKTLGQCSITSFAVQDVLGGEVYGVPLKEGGFHCFNVIGDIIFDLTSEQFGSQKFEYTKDYPQSREDHFANKEKYERYLYIKEQLEKCRKR